MSLFDINNQCWRLLQNSIDSAVIDFSRSTSSTIRFSIG